MRYRKLECRKAIIKKVNFENFGKILEIYFLEKLF